MQPKALAIAVLVVVLTMSACQTNPATTAGARIDIEHTAVGRNLADEDCWVEEGSMAYESIEIADSVFNVYCGEWEWPSARVFRVATNSPELGAWTGDNAWLHMIDRRMLCVVDRISTILDGIEAVLLNCKLHNGGWPYVALIAHVNRATYLADFVPNTQPAVERAIAAVAGVAIATDAPPSAAVLHLQARLRDRMYRTSDLQNYYRAVTLGQYYNSIKSYFQAERQYWNALAIHQQALGVNNAETADALMHIALELSNQEQFARAEDMFQKAAEKLDPGINLNNWSRFIGYYALHAANQRRFAVARKRAHEATEYRQAIETRFATEQKLPSSALDANLSDDGILSLEDDLPHAAEVAHSLYIEAAMLERLGKPDESKSMLAAAQLILSTVGNAPPLWEPQLESLDGVTEETRHAYRESTAARARALALFEARAPGERPTALAYIELARGLVQLDQMDIALDSFQRGIAVARRRSDSFRLGQLAPVLKAALELPGLQPDARQELNRKLFEAAQLIRSGVTSNDIARTVARFAERDDDVGRLMGKLQKTEYERVRKQQEVQAELGRILETGHVDRLNRLNDELSDIDDDLMATNQAVQSISPRYKQLIGSGVSVDDVVGALRPGEAMLQVLVGEDRTFVFLVKEARITAYSVDVSSASISATVNRLRASVLEAGRGIGVTPAAGTPAVDTQLEYDVAAAHGLYQLLFEPIAPEIENVRHLVTVASGPLLSFPFGLFATAPPSTAGDYAGVSWLARHTAISLVPSAQSFVYLRNLAAGSSAPNSLIAFGGFMSAASSVAEQRGLSLPLCEAESEDSWRYFPGLPGTSREVEAVAKTFPSASTRLLLDRDFNEQAVKESNLDDYRIVYFATHALLPDEIECKSEPSLLTTHSSGGESGEDDFLTAGEILELDLNADLVVLSACNTGGAAKAGGESLSGLARSFFFAGARSLLVSHWVAHDAATADLMTRVFEILRSGRAASVAEAVQMAQIDMMDRPQQPGWSSPYFWAAFTLVGDGAQSMAGI